MRDGTYDLRGRVRVVAATLALVLLETDTGRRECPGHHRGVRGRPTPRPPHIPDTLPSCLRHALHDATYQRPEERLIAADLLIRLQHRQ
ncbi:hypothetical protein GCM10025792_10610 [Pseudonocardia tropica]